MRSDPENVEGWEFGGVGVWEVETPYHAPSLSVICCSLKSAVQMEQEKREESDYKLACDLSDIKVTLLCPQNRPSTYAQHEYFLNVCIYVIV